MTKHAEFEQFMIAHRNMVYSTACRILRNEADALDVAQEVFLRAYRHYDRLADNPKAGGWLRRVARNLSLNQITRYRNRWTFFTDLEREEGDEDFAARVAGPETEAQLLDEARRQELLEEALAKLPEKQRLPLTLYHFEDMGYDEIADRLGVSLGKVKTDIFRAREALRKLIRFDEAGDMVRGGVDALRKGR
jgi:RNA polymerase sigma-70 factor (ECF subfamily)